MAFTLELVQRIQLGPRIFQLAFTRPKDLTFLPGQHLRFLYKGLERDYTPVSLAKEETVCICVRQRTAPGFSTTLATCDMGSAFEVSGPHGHFIYSCPRDSGPPLVFIAAGTGIAPFVAFAGAGAAGYLMIQGARTPEGLIYKDRVRPNSRAYLPCLSQPPLAGGVKDVFYGRVTDYLEQVLPHGEYLFYVCGGGQMILDTMGVIDEKFPGSRVFTERFS